MPSQIPLDLLPTESLARDDLIVSPSNAVSVAAIDRWPDWTHNVLLVVGPEGAGKTHLAGAWAAHADAAIVGPGDVARVLRNRDFRAVIDDIDRTSVPEDELFSLVNAARSGEGWVLATSRRSPQAMEGRLADLRSRLAAATYTELGEPDDLLFEAILTKHFSDRQLVVDRGTMAYLASRIERTGSSARRVVGALDRTALAEKSRITKPLVRRVLESLDDPSVSET